MESSIKERAQRAMQLSSFYEDPKKVFIEMVDALPDSQQAWMLAFVWLFVFSSFADEPRPRSSDAKRLREEMMRLYKGEPT